MKDEEECFAEPTASETVIRHCLVRSQLTVNRFHPSSFILHPSSFFILHPFFILLPSDEKS